MFINLLYNHANLHVYLCITSCSTNILTSHLFEPNSSSYVLNGHAKQPVDWFVDDRQQKIIASWNKEFHVSPFMEMDYRYTFSFSEVVFVYFCILIQYIMYTTSFDHFWSTLFMAPH